MALTLSDVSEMSTSSTDKSDCLLSVAQIGDHLVDAATTFVDHRADFCALCQKQVDAFDEHVEKLVTTCAIRDKESDGKR
jgi:hypothetical protein